MKKPQDDRVWVLLARQQSGEATANELAELEALLSNSGITDADRAPLELLWQTPLRVTPVAKMAYPQQLTGHGRYARQNRYKKIRGWAAAAAVILVGVALWLFLPDMGGQRANQMAHIHEGLKTIHSGDRLKTKTVLPDGTLVWLHRNSTISYQAGSFGKLERELTLTGEAFFDVHENKQLPMNVHAGNVVIHVTGTAFNVKAYPGSKAVETALLRGSIEVYEKQRPAKKVRLVPNQKVVTLLQPADAAWTYQIIELEKDHKQVPTETIWMEKRLAFDNEQLQHIAPKLESWYNIRVYFLDDAVKKLRFSAVIEHETLAQTLDAMKLSSNFDYTLTNNELKIGKAPLVRNDQSK